MDILVNAAGFNQRSPTLDFPDADWNQLIDTNLTGTLRACQVFGRHMIERSYGRIINIASTNTQKTVIFGQRRLAGRTQLLLPHRLPAVSG